MKMNSRIPVIALDYAQRHKAVPKELLIDYETGHIYVVSANDKSIIFDITSKILEKLDSVTGDKIIINIEGIGEVNLQEYINQIKLDLEDVVIISEEDNDLYIPRDERLDGLSIESKYRRIQIKDFDTAKNGMIPQKYNNKIRWVYPQQENQDSGRPGTPDPNDGVETRVFLIEPIEGKLFLRASRRLKTKNLQKDALVVLPRTLDQYTEIYWNVRTYAYKPTLRFSDSVLFNTPYQPIENADHVYRFSTWDGGESWYAGVSVYNRDISNESIQSDKIDIEYLEKNYFNKKDIRDNYYSKSEAEKIFLTRQQLDGIYLTRNQIEEGYFNKQQIEELLSWYIQDGSLEIKLPDGYVLR